MLIVLLACNLGETNEQPILDARPSPTPAPTMGYSPLDPIEMPQQSFSSINNTTNDNLEIYNLINQVSSDRMMVDISTLQNFHTRHVNSSKTSTTEGIGAAAAYIEAQFQAIQSQAPSNFYVFTQEFPLEYNGISTVQKNIIAYIQGTEPGAGTIVMGAHYDSVYIDLTDATAFAPGADDNGSGVAIIIELARILSKRQHRTSLMFVAFSAEEVGDKGSIAFVRDYIQKNNVDVLGMINLDTLGSDNDRNGRVINNQVRVYYDPTAKTESAEFARMVNFAAFNLPPGTDFVLQNEIDREGRYGDHESFSNAGYPAVRLIESLEAKVNGDPNDVIGEIEAGYLEQNAQAVLSVITSLADGPRPAGNEWNMTLRDRGDGLRTLVWEPVPDAVSYIVALRSPGSLYYDRQFEVSDTSVDWDGFTANRFVGLAIAAKDSNGMIGPLSPEYTIP